MARKSKAPLKLNKTPRIKRAVRREETTLRLGGIGDNYHMSWAADDRQFVSVCDGMGWFDRPKGLYNSRLWAISGNPRDAAFEDSPGYPELIPTMGAEINPNLPGYYNFGTLALERRIYQFLSTNDRPPFRFVGAKLIYSPDNGRTWCNQNGSTPVVWEFRERRSRENMVFFNEPQDAFSLLSILQMGRNYEANRDGYVYVYAPNGNTEGTMNQLVMFRVPKARILNRGAYEYFAGLRTDGSATWAKDINARGIVHTFPSGWVNKTVHPWAWIPSVTYNAPLSLYMMANWATSPAADGYWFGKPSYLGFWASPNPWGQWEQIHEESAWMPDNDPAARAYSPQIAPKWIAEDGKSFWLVWSDYQGGRDFERAWGPMREEVNRTGGGQEAWAQAESQLFRRYMPHYSFNTQRVDLVLA